MTEGKVLESQESTEPGMSIGKKRLEEERKSARNEGLYTSVAGMRGDT